jgi:hypothetical protein
MNEIFTWRRTPNASTSHPAREHRTTSRTHLLMRCDAMRCVSRVEVEPQEACLSNLLRTSFADRARMIIIIIIIVSRAVGSGKRRETQERNEKKTKKIFFLRWTQSRVASSWLQREFDHHRSRDCDL